MIAISVKELAIHIKTFIEEGFANIEVCGEAIMIKKHISGHLYFSLKENDFTIDCILWKSSKIMLQPAEGLQVVCKGYLTTYPSRSKYQFVVKEIKPYGVGALLKLIEERRERLKTEGLFDIARKKPLPKFPRMIGIITSPSGAVIHDMMHRISERYPCNILLYPINVQGDKMPAEAIQAIKYLEESSVDIIILARGGGSFNDLLGFQEEEVVRVVAACKKPIISAIGHETDITLCDHAADLRAPTPTAAIELCTPDRRVLIKILEDFDERINFLLNQMLKNATKILDFQGLCNMDGLLSNSYQRLDHLYSILLVEIFRQLKEKNFILGSLNLKFATIQQKIRQNITLLKHSKITILTIIVNKLEKLKLSLSSITNTLQTVSYKETLKRGFCRAYTKFGPINSSNEALRQQSFTIEFSKGKTKVVTVNSIPKLKFN